MNRSGNLISLSDSGAGPSLSLSSVAINIEEPGSGGHVRDDEFSSTGKLSDGVFSNEFGIELSDNSTKNDSVDGGTGLLIDFSDEVQVPTHRGILLQAEIDDTFGIFSMAQQQSSQGSVGRGSEGSWATTVSDEEEDEAAKLVRSFTSGRKSDGIKGKKESSKETGNINSEDGNKSNDSDVSVASDQPTIIESEGPASPKLPGIEEKGSIVDEKMDQTTASNFSGGSGSDSEILDVGNLSSFSIPEEEIDDSKFIEDIKREDMARSSKTRAIVNQIKLDILQAEDEAEEGNDVDAIGANGSSYFRSEQYEHGLLIDVPRPSLASSTRSTINNRLSSSSTTSSGSRWSTSSQKNSTVLGDGFFTSSRGSSASSSGTGSISTGKPATTRTRLSSSNFGSPIRASYPISNRYFMPTPKAKTPSAAAFTPRDRDHYLDRLSESLSSPSRTRVMLITGDSYRSPTRAPVRKSISAETLHYEYGKCSPPREMQRHVVKFSTPSASKKSRHSFSNNLGVSEYPNFFGDDRPGASQRNQANPTFYVDRGELQIQPDREEFMQYRKGRVSYASSASNTSIHTLSPTNSTIYTREIRAITCQMNRINLNDSSISSKGNKVNVQPIKATAVIAPTNISKPNSKPATSSASNRSGLHAPPKPKATVDHSGHYRPIASSSPVPAAGTLSTGRPGSNQTTPTRSRYANNIRSSGYGGQQNLNSTFGANQPLKSPNKATSTTASIKPPAIPKSLKTGVPTLGSKLELGSRGGGSTTSKIGGITALKPAGKLPVPGTSGLRRPAVTSTVSTSNKENKPKSSATTATSRIVMRRYHH